MSDPTRIPNAIGAARTNAPAQPTQSPRAPATSAAFHVLIEKLEEQAKELEASTRTVSDAKDLAGAVDRARDSFQEALSLGESLIEAYRQSLHQSSDASLVRARSGDATISRAGDATRSRSGDAAIPRAGDVTIPHVGDGSAPSSR